MTNIEELKSNLAEISYLSQAAGVLCWDQNTYMPEGSALSRAKQLSTLSEIIHKKSTSDHMRSLIERAEDEAGALPEGALDRDLLRILRRDFDQWTKLPTEFVVEESELSSIAQTEWAKARKENDYKAFAPYLKKQIDLSRRKADYLGYAEQPYDALLDQHEPGLTTNAAKRLFDTARPILVDLVKSVTENGKPVDDSCLRRFYPEAEQEKLSLKVAQLIGYDTTRGRLDRTTHPFEISFSQDDVRITTRFDERNLPYCLSSVIHETGHAMYEQNIGRDISNTNLASGCSSGVHESQSRLWENIVGRSRGFLKAIFPLILESFPGTVQAEEEELFFRAFNKVEPSFIRTEADEATYNLHIFLRFELELALLSGELNVEDAPAAWNEKTKESFGLTPPTDALGILQDVHWSMGSFGYFPTYSIGNFLSAQLYETALAAHPEIPAEIEIGKFSTLFNWLHDNIWRHGRRWLPQELVLKATGKPLDATAFTRYLTRKIKSIYEL
jgi:carboxypeptidase Taq